ncbi:membrane protein insertion efficiency factor YidD [bacterium]|nr:membrane protein insertion efficiency factor YidD [bacterium]
MTVIFDWYQRWFSPIVHAIVKLLSGNPYEGCRFEPTCSVYAREAVKTFGWRRGGLKALGRLCRCHPLSGQGGFDPV